MTFAKPKHPSLVECLEVDAIQALNLRKNLQQNRKVLKSRRDVFLAKGWTEAQRDGSLQ